MKRQGKETYLNQKKICPVCLREFHNRAKWAKRNLWTEVKYCSDKCRKNAGLENKNINTFVISNKNINN